MGTPGFAVPTLKALIAQGHRVVCVVTQPDRPKGRGRKLAAPPVKEVALVHHIPLLQPTKIRGDDFLAGLKEYKPDLIVVAAYGRILPGRLIDMPPLGTINVHASLLPKYRGAAPVQWAIINGEGETGVTIMQMDEGLDTGSILLAEKIPIDPDDTAASLMEKLAELGAGALNSALDLLAAGKLPPAAQDDGLATLAPPLSKEQGLVDWSKSAFAISCLIRGLDPWPCAYTFLEKKRLRLFTPRVIDDPAESSRLAQALSGRGLQPAPGMICRADSDGVAIAAGKGYLSVGEIQPEGGKRMSADAFLRGHSLAIGKVFHSSI